MYPFNLRYLNEPTQYSQKQQKELCCIVTVLSATSSVKMGLTFPADPPHDGLACTLHTSSLFSPFQRVNPSFCLKDAESEIRPDRITSVPGKNS